MISLNTDAWGGKKEEPDHLKGEFFVKLICDINGTDVEISEMKLNDFVKNVTVEVTESILKNLKGENLKQQNKSPIDNRVNIW